MRILGEWGIQLSYPAALRAEMLSMLAKYIPGAIWAPAARVVAARRAGVTDAALVTSSMLLEAGLSAVAGVIVFVVSLPFVDDVDAPLGPLVAFGAVLAILVQPRVFRPVAGWVLRQVRLHEGAAGHARTDDQRCCSSSTPARGCSAASRSGCCCARSAPIPKPATIVYLGGTAAVGAIVAVLFVFAPSGIGLREASMYGLLLAVATPGQALGAVALNRVALTLVELLVLFLGGVLLRGGREPAPAAELPSALRQCTS